MKRVIFKRYLNRFGYPGWRDICDKLHTNYGLADIVQDELADEYAVVFPIGVWRQYAGTLDIMVDGKIVG